MAIKTSYFKIVFFFLLWISTVCAQEQDYLFPLRISSDQRYFEDQSGKTFFYSADTAWKLFLKLDLEEAQHYLEDRKRNGFTVVQTMLTGFDGNTDIAGRRPFSDSNDFSTVNDEYMEHVQEVIQIAESLNLVIAIAPLWAGCCGEGYGGRNEFMNNNGIDKSRWFGEYLAQKFGKFDNIFWIIGGDNDPKTSVEEYDALAKALKANAPHQLMTYHAASTHSSTDVWDNPDWLDVSMIYTYFRGFNKAWNWRQPDVYEVGYTEYQKTPKRPFFLGESTYEREHDPMGSPLQVRKQAYWSVFSGGAGHAYGSANWNIPPEWKENLRNFKGAITLVHLKNLFHSLPWTKVRPDISGSLIVGGNDTYATNDHATSVIAHDGGFALSYVPSQRSFTVNPQTLKGKKLDAYWYNPINGKVDYLGSYSTKGSIDFTSPSAQDWVLILDAGNTEFKLK